MLLIKNVVIKLYIYVSCYLALAPYIDNIYLTSLQYGLSALRSLQKKTKVYALPLMDPSKLGIIRELLRDLKYLKNLPRSGCSQRDIANFNLQFWLIADLLFTENRC